jgi:hypothetical protein
VVAAGEDVAYDMLRLRSEVGAIATDANADNPGSEVVPELLRGRPRFSCLESSGGNVVDGGVESGFPNEWANSEADGS